MRYLLPILVLVAGCARSAPPPKAPPPPAKVTANDCNKAYDNLLDVALLEADEQFTPEQRPAAKMVLDTMWRADGHSETFFNVCLTVANFEQVSCMQHAPRLEGMSTCIRQFATKTNGK